MRKLLGVLVLLGALTFGMNTQVQAEEAATVDASSEEAMADDGEATTEAPTTQVYDEKAAVVPYQLVFVSDSGHEEVLKAGYGFFVGDKTKSVYMITCNNTAVLNDAEKQAVAARYAVEANKINTKIRR